MTGRPLSDLICVEIFAGSGGFTRKPSTISGVLCACWTLPCLQGKTSFGRFWSPLTCVRAIWLRFVARRPQHSRWPVLAAASQKC